MNDSTQDGKNQYGYPEVAFTDQVKGLKGSLFNVLVSVGGVP